MASRYTQQEQVLGTTLLSDIHSAPLLVVGAGGIGCELLKNLVLSGFHSIEIIDLDTIDLSNLNRQFLFRKQHIGESKAKVARESALQFNSNCNIVAHHGNIKDAQFGPDYFSRFKLVLNALDNIEARKHVNRMCLAADVPLIESGTAGFLGQVQVIKKNTFECYECRPINRQKSYAYCTIHNTPSKPIHCIVWAKIKFSDNFTASDNSAGDEEELVNDPVMMAEEEELAREKEHSKTKWLFRKLFYRDILKRIRMAEVAGQDIWKGKRPPKPLLPPAIDALETTGAAFGGLQDQKSWSLEENIQIFYSATNNLFKRFEERGTIEWDKDDDDALNFVASASNIRSHMFEIGMLTRFDIKAIAGNIIPAIATTNAIIAGLIVLEAFKLLSGKTSSCKYTYLLRRPSGNRLLMDVEMEPPNPNCYICSSKQIRIKLDTTQITIEFFADEILKKELGMVHPALYVESNNIYECSDDMDEDEIEEMKEQGSKTLADAGLKDTLLRVHDEHQDISLEITLVHSEYEKEDEAAEESKPKFEILGAVGKLEPVKAPDAVPTTTTASTNNGTTTTAPADDDDDIIMEVGEKSSLLTKRSREQITDTTDQEPAAKKAKIL